MHEMWTVAVNDSGRLSGCLSHSFAVQTQLNGSRSCLGWRLLEMQVTYIALDGSPGAKFTNGIIRFILIYVLWSSYDMSYDAVRLSLCHVISRLYCWIYLMWWRQPRHHVHAITHFRMVSCVNNVLFLSTYCTASCPKSDRNILSEDMS